MIGYRLLVVSSLVATFLLAGCAQTLVPPDPERPQDYRSEMFEKDDLMGVADVVNVSDQPVEVSFSVEENMIYATSYVWRLDSWEDIALDGAQPIQRWYRGSVSGSLSVDRDSWPEGTYAVAVYACERVGTAWQCGDWVVDEFEVVHEDNAPTTAQGSVFTVSLFDSVLYDGTLIDLLAANANTDSVIIEVEGDREEIQQGDIVTVGGLQMRASGVFVTNIPTLDGQATLEVLNVSDPEPIYGVWLELNTPITDDGYELELLGGNIEDQSVVISVNSDQESVEEGESVTVGGVDIVVGDVFVTDIPRLDAMAHMILNYQSCKSIGGVCKAYVPSLPQDGCEESLDGFNRPHSSAQCTVAGTDEVDRERVCCIPGSAS